MNFKLIICIAMGAFVAHLAIFMIYMRINFHPTAPPPPRKPNFTTAQEVVRDAKTGAKTVHQEFTISTRLAPPGTYQGRPDQPVNE